MVEYESHSEDLKHTLNREGVGEDRLAILHKLVDTGLVIGIGVVLDTQQKRVEHDESNNNMVETFVSDDPHNTVPDRVSFGKDPQTFLGEGVVLAVGKELRRVILRV